MLKNLRELYQYRALLMSLVQRELRARYRGSVLGFLWTFLNPTLHMLVYAVLFRVVMRSAVPNYTYFLFVGMLPWIWFSTSIQSGAAAISDRRDLLTKVRFPAQVLPATSVITNLANYIFALPLLLALGAFYRIWPTWHVVFFPLILLIQAALILGIVYLISALNVTFRDLQHIVSNLLMLAFFLTPVLFPSSQIPEKYRQLAKALNPMSPILDAYHAIFYDHVMPNFTDLSIVAATALGMLWVACRVFESRREDFAEAI